MTLRKKILVWILLLTLLIILAMSGTYYLLFNQQIKSHSQSEVVSAFELVRDDLRTKAVDALPKIDRFIRSSLVGPMYLVELLQNQHVAQEGEWTVRDIRRIIPHLSAITNEMQKFGELAGAIEIAVYDSRKNLLALYSRAHEDEVLGVYWPELFKNEYIPMRADDEWLTTLQSIDDIPHAAFVERVPLSLTSEIEREAGVGLSVEAHLIHITLTVPIVQKNEIGGVCVVHLALQQADVERYARLTQTQVNVFAGTTLSVGTLAQQETPHQTATGTWYRMDDAQAPETLPLTFAYVTVAGQDYYQGQLLFGDQHQVLGAITANFPLIVERESRRMFILLVVTVAVVFGILTAVSASILTGFIVRPISSLTRSIQQLAQGHLSVVAERKNALITGPLQRKTLAGSSDHHDELAQLRHAFLAMIDYLQEMADVAERISRGEINQKITPRSHDDVLGQAFSRMTGYLTQIAGAATAVAEGDLRVEIHSQSERDVLGQAFERMESLRELMGEIVHEADRLKAMSEELQHISVNMVADAEQSSQQTQAVVSNSLQVSQNVHEVSIATTQMTASIQEISQTVHRIAETVRVAAKAAETANVTMTDLGNHSQEIGNIIKLITSIAQQTNLLALNATIEAARAGDTGRGFAVVAGEVKELARETTRSADDITAKVEAIQSSSANATTSLENMVKDIEHLDEILTIIVSAITQQVATTEVITNNLNNAASGTEEVTALISEVAAVAEKSSEMAGRIQDFAEQQSHVAEQFQRLIGRFKI